MSAVNREIEKLLAVEFKTVFAHRVLWSAFHCPDIRMARWL